MKITTKGRYALRLMLDLARNDNGGYIPLKDVSARQGITIKYLERIVAVLNKAGYIDSSRGSGGGHRIACDLKACSARDILLAVEGEISIACVGHEPNDCCRLESCATFPLWKGLTQAVNHYLDSVSLDDMLKGQVI